MNNSHSRNFILKRVFLILLVICCSCSEQKSIPVDIYGVSFNYFAGWEVTDMEDYGVAKYICVEKKGDTASGVVTLSFIKEEYKLEDYLQLFQESLLEQTVMENLVFQEANEAYYGKYKGIVSAYTCETQSIKHEGKIYVFYKNGITMCVVCQEAVEDHNENLQGFKTIEESLNF